MNDENFSHLKFPQWVKKEKLKSLWKFIGEKTVLFIKKKGIPFKKNGFTSISYHLEFYKDNNNKKENNYLKNGI